MISKIHSTSSVTSGNAFAKTLSSSRWIVLVLKMPIRLLEHFFVVGSGCMYEGAPLHRPVWLMDFRQASMEALE